MDYYEEYSDYPQDFPQTDYYDIESEDNYDLMSDCILPTLSDGFNKFLAPILVANIFLKLVTLCVDNMFATHILTIGTGLSLLLFHFYDDFNLFVFLMVYLSIGSLLSLMASKHKTIVWMVSISFICLNESMVWFNPSFIRLRSHQMLLVMKIISFNSMINEKSDDKVKDNHTIKTLLSSLSYLLHPLSSLLGVWHPFVVHKTNKSFILSFIQCMYYLMISIVFLLLSTCLIHQYIGHRLIPFVVTSLVTVMPMSLVYVIEICLTVYITALQFRCSHYFICFATQSMLQLWNSDLRVTNPVSIELPRSLVDVVIAWNIPMHIWLKTHVFNPSKKSFGAFQAIFITYFISSFLHGFNFQIWSVLLSLGILTKLEYDLREELSQIFNACIHVRRCLYRNADSMNENQSLKCNVWDVLRWKGSPKVCVSKWKHKNTEYNSRRVVVVNVLFAVLAITHLAYLGSTFDGKEESSKVSNVLAVWKELKFFSHLISIVTFIIYKII